MKRTGNFRCCVGLVLLHSSGCQLSLLLLLDWENSALSVASVEKHTVVQC